MIEPWKFFHGFFSIEYFAGKNFMTACIFRNVAYINVVDAEKVH